MKSAYLKKGLSMLLLLLFLIPVIPSLSFTRVTILGDFEHHSFLHRHCPKPGFEYSSSITRSRGLLRPDNPQAPH